MTTPDLPTFLTQRYDEQEMRVRLVETVPPKWTMTVHPHDGERIPVEVEALTPAYVLADLAAKRRIVGLAAEQPETFAEALCYLAQPFADHPDFRPEWKL